MMPSLSINWGIFCWAKLKINMVQDIAKAFRKEFTSNNPLPISQQSQDNATVTRLQMASDLSQTFTYFDVGTSDERISTIIYYSPSLGLTLTETFSYAGSAGAYRISSIVRS